MAGVDRANSGSHLGHYDTIVLGSGIAGLAYASRLLQLQQPNNHGGGTNRRLQIIEARDRIGGRIASVHVDGWRLNPGANWIHGICNAKRSNPLTQILPHKRYRALKGCVLFRAPASNDGEDGNFSGSKTKNNGRTAGEGRHSKEVSHLGQRAAHLIYPATSTTTSTDLLDRVAPGPINPRSYGLNT